MLCPQCSFGIIGTEQFCPDCGVTLGQPETSSKPNPLSLLASGTLLANKFRIETGYADSTGNCYEAIQLSTGRKILIEEANICLKTITAPVQEATEPAIRTSEDNQQLTSDNDCVATISLKEKFDLLNAVDCPTCSKALDFFTLDSKEYLVIEPPAGKNLASLVSKDKPSEDLAIDIIMKLCECVDAIHRQGYLHLNIEPNNIYLSDGQVSILDFGRAMKQGNSRLDYLTTDGFSAPELMIPDGVIIDARADIYSIGAVLFWMLSGEKIPLSGISPSQVVSAVSSPDLARILLPCIASAVNSRYGTATELKERLRSYQEHKRKALRYDSASLSNIGMVRQNNEDACLVLELLRSANSKSDSYGIYLVADGMGGHAAGEIASTKAIETISSTITAALYLADRQTSFSELVKQSIEKANSEIHNMAQDNPTLRSAGTTVTLGLRINNELYLGHVGDSRCYLIRDGEIKQLTRDHSVVGGLLERGMITPEQAKLHPDRGKIYRSLDSTPTVSIDTLETAGYGGRLALQRGDKLVFCTDGLTNTVSDEEILGNVEREADARSVCRDLVHLANARGGDDNITVIVVKVTTSY